MGKKLKPTQLTAVMINLQDMLNVFMRKLNQLTVMMKPTLVKVPAEELLVKLGKVVKVVNLNLNQVRKILVKLNQERKLKVNQERELKKQRRTKNQLKEERRTKNQLKEVRRKLERRTRKVPKVKVKNQLKVKSLRKLLKVKNQLKVKKLKNLRNQLRKVRKVRKLRKVENLRLKKVRNPRRRRYSLTSKLWKA